MRMDAPSTATPDDAVVDLFGEEVGPARRSGLGAAMAGGNRSGPPPRRQFYRTPRDATRALLGVLDLPAGTPVAEPCCGDGAIASVLEGAGHPVAASDLDDRGWGTPGVDVLGMRSLPADVVVTNPPFSLAAEIVDTVLDLRPSVLALLLKATFFHADVRRALFDRHTPAEIHALTWRLDFEGRGAPAMECAWFVWRRDHVGDCAYRLLPRPGAEQIEIPGIADRPS